MNPGDDLPEQVTLWRCAQCGKWSFAKRRPVSHVRSLRNLEPFEQLPEGRTHHDANEQAAHWELPTVREFEVRPWSGDPDMSPDLGGITIKCGPFVEYTAYLRAQWHKDAKAREHARALSAEGAG